MNLFFLGIHYGTIAPIITWIPAPKLTQLGYSKACTCSYCGCWQMHMKWPGKEHLLHQYNTGSQGMELGSVILNLNLSDSKWNGNTWTSPRKKKLSAWNPEQILWLMSFVMRKVLFFKLLAYGNSTLTAVLKH